MSKKHHWYIRGSRAKEHLHKLYEVERAINIQLAAYPNFDGIDFCDVSAGGIQIRGHHKQVMGYTYGGQPTIKYDFSNYQQCIEEFVDMWKSLDSPDSVDSYNEFIDSGDKYGWD